MIIQGDCREALRGLSDASIDACVTDPPYGLSFMGKAWDYDVPSADTWREVYRVMKPGAHLLAFFGSRTYHRGVVQIEDAGFEIRDQIMWVYGSGFPKSLDVSKAIDKAAGAKREVVTEGKPVKRMIPGADQNATGSWIKDNGRVFVPTETAPATDAARQWEGWGTALKPAHEPIVVARKPLVGTVVENVQRFGTGAINIDASRIAFADPADEQEAKTKNQHAAFGSGPMTNQVFGKFTKDREDYNPPGRWPANVIHDGSEEVVALFSDAARFFYCAKASKADRGAGNNHPTVKPTALMRYLVRLVTPPKGLVLDPFAGSGSTGKAAMLEGFDFIGVERDPDFAELAWRRIREAGIEAMFLEETA